MFTDGTIHSTEGDALERLVRGIEGDHVGKGGSLMGSFAQFKSRFGLLIRGFLSVDQWSWNAVIHLLTCLIIVF